MLVAPRTSQISGLLDRLHGGDASAREALIAYAADRLNTLAQEMLRANRLQRWEQSDDLLQQTLMRLSGSIDNGQIDNVRSFFRLASLEMRHALIDLARRYFGPNGIGTHHETQGSDSPGHPVRVFVSSDDARMARVEAMRRLYDAIESLPEEERDVVDLLWFHDLSQIEAAAVLGVATKTVARRWARARLRLHQDLGEDGSIGRV